MRRGLEHKVGDRVSGGSWQRDLDHLAGDSKRRWVCFGLSVRISDNDFVLNKVGRLFENELYS